MGKHGGIWHGHAEAKLLLKRTYLNISMSQIKIGGMRDEFPTGPEWLLLNCPDYVAPETQSPVLPKTIIGRQACQKKQLHSKAIYNARLLLVHLCLPCAYFTFRGWQKTKWEMSMNEPVRATGPQAKMRKATQFTPPPTQTSNYNKQAQLWQLLVGAESVACTCGNRVLIRNQRPNDKWRGDAKRVMNKWGFICQVNHINGLKPLKILS